MYWSLELLVNACSLALNLYLLIAWTKAKATVKRSEEEPDPEDFRDAVRPSR